MFRLSPQRSVFINQLYRPNLEKNDFQMIFEKDKFVLYKNKYFNPVVIHFPGSRPANNLNQNRHWLNYFIDEMDTSAYFPIQKIQENIHILQINNYLTPNKYINPGEYFLNKAGVFYYSTGKNIEPFQWELSLKILLLRDLLHKIPIVETPQYFLFFDSSDAVLVGQPEQLINALQEYNCNILFGMDAFIHNSYSWKRNVIKTPPYMAGYVNNHYRFLNSGIIFGKVHIMKQIVSYLINKYVINEGFPHTCDQHYYHQARFDFFNDIEVDYKRKYLLNIFHKEGFFEKYQKDS